MASLAQLTILGAIACCATVSNAQTPTRESLVSVGKARVQSRDVYVWLPEGDIGPVTRFPVLVLLDAQDQNQFRSALANIRYLIDRRVIPPLMVIGVPFGASRDHDLTPPAKGDIPPALQMLDEKPGGADAMGRFIIDELLPWADAHYPTLPVRLLAGHSFGGLFALYTAAMRPGVFRVVIAMSPSLWWNGGATGADLAARFAADSTHTRTIFITSGAVEGPLDQAATQFATTLTSLVHDSAAMHLAFAHRRYARDNHGMTPLPSLVDGLRWAYAPMLVPVDSVFASLMSGPPQDSGQIVAVWQQLESSFHAGAASLGVPDAPFPEYTLNLLAYYCTQVKQLRLANRLFLDNAKRYPKSSNAAESLAEGLLAVNDTSGAVAAFHRALALSTRGDDINAILSHAILRRLHQEVGPAGSSGH